MAGIDVLPLLKSYCASGPASSGGTPAPSAPVQAKSLHGRGGRGGRAGRGGGRSGRGGRGRGAAVGHTWRGRGRGRGRGLRVSSSPLVPAARLSADACTSAHADAVAEADAPQPVLRTTSASSSLLHGEQRECTDGQSMQWLGSGLIEHQRPMQAAAASWLDASPMSAPLTGYADAPSGLASPPPRWHRDGQNDSGAARLPAAAAAKGNFAEVADAAVAPSSVLHRTCSLDKRRAAAAAAAAACARERRVRMLVGRPIVSSAAERCALPGNVANEADACAAGNHGEATRLAAATQPFEAPASAIGAASQGAVNSTYGGSWTAMLDEVIATPNHAPGLETGATGLVAGAISADLVTPSAMQYGGALNVVETGREALAAGTYGQRGMGLATAVAAPGSMPTATSKRSRGAAHESSAQRVRLNHASHTPAPDADIHSWAFASPPTGISTKDKQQTALVEHPAQPQAWMPPQSSIPAQQRAGSGQAVGSATGASHGRTKELYTVNRISNPLGYEIYTALPAVNVSLHAMRACVWLT
eukprot:363291-Chlamydomonas_euryale.AAC.29